MKLYLAIDKRDFKILVCAKNLGTAKALLKGQGCYNKKETSMQYIGKTSVLKKGIIVEEWKEY